MQIRSFLVAALAAGTAMAHMNMKDPPPLAYKGNPNSKDPNIDYSITSPITQAQYPCKGYLKLLGTPEGASVKTYAPGGQYSMSVEGGAYHNGGSCQLSLSYDKGNSFTVIKSFIGNCPTASGGTFNFDMPSDTPEGDDVVFAWTWVNHTGNREYYMSCAVVTIKAGASKRDVPVKRATTPFASRPKVFEANLGGEYCTKEGVDTVYPEPGPDVENTSTSPGPAILCSTGADAPEGSSSGGSGSGSSASAGASSAAATSYAATSAAVSSATSAASQYSTSAAAQTSATGGVFLTVPPSSSGAASTSAAASAAAPTTFSTATVATQSAGAGTGASSSAAAGGSSGSATTSAKAPTTTGGVTGTQSGACTDEGAWACSSDGSSFQRCASGQWSAAMPMAAGTKCNPGISNTLSMRRRRDRVRRSGTGLGGLAF
ncbi:lytic polysaccharide monooxygenase [Jackrogersella minutella]|nr:lytic polysaccharide monooxygenase [Jackrogersella minutella]